MFVPRSRFVAVGAALLILACGTKEKPQVDTTTPSSTPAPPPSGAASTAPAADSMILVRGSLASVTPTELVVKTDSTTVTVSTPQPIQVFAREPSNLSHVAPNSFVGVTTVKQADGSEKATEIHIFAEALRGLGEGSRMMNPPATGNSASRMTNGSVSGAQPANDAAAAKMSNGSVATSNGATIVVQFAGGSTTAVVPPNTPVTEIKQTHEKLAVGDRVTVVGIRTPGGTLTAQKVLLSNQPRVSER